MPTEPPAPASRAGRGGGGLAFDAALFDFDGTLAQSEGLHRLAFSEVLGVEIDEEEWERAVIWDEAPPQAKRRKVPLVLDLNDAHMLFDKVSPMMTMATDA